MHEAGFAATGRPGRYVACDVVPAGLETAIRGMAALGFTGCNCTVPLKESACALATVRSPEAQAMGSANTLAFRSGAVYADSTDGRGFLRALAEQVGWGASGARVVLLGAGGSARSIAAALRRGGAEVTVANRTLERAQRLAADIDPGIRAIAAGNGDLEPALRNLDLLVNCTTVGMDGHTSPVSAESLALLPRGAVVCDIVYTPRETTPLLGAAAARGLTTVGGIGMLAWQAALAWEVWFGETGPAGAFAEAARDCLRRRNPAAEDPGTK